MTLKLCRRKNEIQKLKIDFLLKLGGYTGLKLKANIHPFIENNINRIKSMSSYKMFLLFKISLQD